MGDTHCFVLSWQWHREDLSVCCTTIIFAVLFWSFWAYLEGPKDANIYTKLWRAASTNQSRKVVQNGILALQRYVCRVMVLAWFDTTWQNQHKAKLENFYPTSGVDLCPLHITYLSVLSLSFSTGWRLCCFSLWLGWMSRPTQKKGN